jgi:hypothetical protein
MVTSNSRKTFVTLLCLFLLLIVPASAENVIAYSQQLDNVAYHILVSEVEDTKTNTITLTVKEDVKTAIFNILSDYAGRCPIGKPTTGTPL